MKIQLLKGSFEPKELEKIIADLIQVKIKFHEEKIELDGDEESMKMRENRIIKLQNELAQVRNFIESNGKKISVESEINLTA